MSAGYTQEAGNGRCLSGKPRLLLVAFCHNKCSRGRLCIIDVCGGNSIGICCGENIISIDRCDKQKLSSLNDTSVCSSAAAATVLLDDELIFCFFFMLAFSTANLLMLFCQEQLSQHLFYKVLHIGARGKLAFKKRCLI